MLSLLRKILPAQVIPWYHLFLAWFGAMLYGFPSRSMTIVGVTGTNGKSTVVYLLARILEAAGKKAAASSSIEFQIGELRWPNTHKMTMPGRLFLQRFLRKAARSGCTHVVLEVTSEGLAQYRHRFIDFDVAVFLNISPEHIERHGSYERYRAAKGELFRALKTLNPKPETLNKSQALNPKSQKTIVVNLADKEAGYFLRFSADRYVGFRAGERRAALPPGGEELVADEVQQGANGLSFTVHGVPFSSPLLGEMNVENILAAITAAYAVGVPLEECAAAIKNISVIPGRLEEIPNDRGFRIFVDYAHNPAALESVYKTLQRVSEKAMKRESKMICVLGAAGGGRDKWKRPKLGEIAAQYCDRIFVTNEDPYDEDPQQIMRDVAAGARSLRPTAYGLQPVIEEVLDRKGAIKGAIDAAEPGDAIVITGKGCEPWMMVARGKKVLWDDRDVVRTALRESQPVDTRPFRE